MLQQEDPDSRLHPAACWLRDPGGLVPGSNLLCHTGALSQLEGLLCRLGHNVKFLPYIIGAQKVPTVAFLPLTWKAPSPSASLRSHRRHLQVAQLHSQWPSSTPGGPRDPRARPRSALQASCPHWPHAGLLVQGQTNNLNGGGGVTGGGQGRKLLPGGQTRPVTALHAAATPFKINE